MARAHLSQLIDMFGTDGCLRINTTAAPDTVGLAPGVAPDSGEPENEEPS